MARFPITEAEKVALSQTLVQGLQDNSSIYPAPPVAFAELEQRLAEYIAAKNAAIKARATSEQATQAKEKALRSLVEGMKKDIRYAENNVDYDNEKLKLLGWSRRKTPAPKTPPGQVVSLTIGKHGMDWVQLKWKCPPEGGKPNAYKILCCEQPEEGWKQVQTSVTKEATLVEQTRDKKLEYRVVAVNNSGEGEPSNTVTIIL